MGAAGCVGGVGEEVQHVGGGRERVVFEVPVLVSTGAEGSVLILETDVQTGTHGQTNMPKKNTLRLKYNIQK